MLIFDEVITGFRVARGGAQELTGIGADLVTLGKVLGGGLPVAAYAGPSRLMQLIAPAGPVYQAGTLAGNPVGMAAGLATLRLLDDEAYTALESRGASLESALRLAFSAAGERVAVHRAGSLLTAFFRIAAPRNYAEASAADPRLFAEFFRRMRRAGVLLPPSPLESWFLSLAHGEADIVAIADAALRAARDLPAARSS